MSDDDEFGKLLAEVTDDPELAQRMRRAIERKRDVLDRIAWAGSGMNFGPEP